MTGKKIEDVAYEASKAHEFFEKINAGLPETPGPITVSEETEAWLIGISKAPAEDFVPEEPLDLTTDMIVREETETPTGRTVRYTRTPGDTEGS
jgi:hypothetical protein